MWTYVNNPCVCFLCVCVCLYACAYPFMYCVNIYIHTCIHACIHPYIHPSIHTYITYIHLYVYIRIYIYTYIHGYGCTCVCRYTYTYTYLYVLSKPLREMVLGRWWISRPSHEVGVWPNRVGPNMKPLTICIYIGRSWYTLVGFCICLKNVDICI